MKALYIILRLFFTPKCWHRWEERDKYSVQYEGEGYARYSYRDFSTGFSVCQCSKCGAWKSFRI